ncbi:MULTISPECIES: nucleotidyltransferase family protein [unclassified Halomonas]|uniref:nucleotidyltransferase family protein n=1 Tax=unclassified Halomonas TaxID=2609666 RepID=UPI00209F1610|nr:MULTISPECIES: nucleotidyltransferase family protein [unclassified Halomonas]MCP1314601.1 nucleotidyltransferase family protein [Halomonas sp. 707D7]MCP1326867.1 nucleotidyltransferase family protein [Halomonas sp. 707D4]
MNYEARIKQWIADDSKRMRALSAAASLDLPDWCLAAGFVRNLVWDKVHGFLSLTALNDIDLIYFDPVDNSEVRDRQLEQQLTSVLDFPWSVKNQARMYRRNCDSPYTSTSDAMSYWVEVETAVGAALNNSGDVVLVSPFGFDPLFNFTVTINAKRSKLQDFEERITTKRWLEIWPRLVVNA